MTNTVRILVSGIVATAIMTMMMMVAPYMGLPKMEVPKMLSAMTHTPEIVGWLMHFMIGIFYAFIFAKYFNAWLHKIDNNVLRGLTYGFIVFVFAQIMLPILMQIMPPPEMPTPENQKVMLMMLGSLIGHLVYGATVGCFYNKTVANIIESHI